MAQMRAAIYVRQSVREDEGIERQLARCASLAKARDWEVLSPYIDNETSASKPRGNGTAWARLLDDIDAGHVDVVVSVNLDRLLRGITDLSSLLTRGAKVVTVEGDLDLSTDSGEFQATMLAAVARFEVRRKASRAAASAATRRAAGHPSPGRVPFGYSWISKSSRDASERRYRVHPIESRIVRSMFDEILAVNDPKSIRAICRNLNAEGTKTRDGAVWSSSTVRRMLLSPFYAGLLPERQNVYPYKAEQVDIGRCSPGAWDPIVSRDELLAVRALLTDPSRRTNGGNVGRRWLLSGVARCGVCGGLVRSARTKERYRGYRCAVGHFQRRADIIDQYVEHVIIERLRQPDAAGLISPKVEIDVTALRASRAALVGRSRELLLLVNSGRYTSSEVLPMKDEHDVLIAKMDAQLSDAIRVSPLAEMVNADDVKSCWASLSLARKQAVLRELLIPVVHQVGKGKRITTLDAAAASVSIVWRKGNRSNVALPLLFSEVGFETHPAVSEHSKRILLGLFA